MKQFEQDNLVCQNKFINGIRTLIRSTPLEDASVQQTHRLTLLRAAAQEPAQPLPPPLLRSIQVAAQVYTRVLQTVGMPLQCNTVIQRSCGCQRGARHKCTLGSCPMIRPCRKVRLTHSPRTLKPQIETISFFCLYKIRQRHDQLQSIHSWRIGQNQNALKIWYLHRLPWDMSALQSL